MIKFWKSKLLTLALKNRIKDCVHTTSILVVYNRSLPNVYSNVTAKGKTGCPVRPPEPSSKPSDVRSLLHTQSVDENEGKYFYMNFLKL